jgi:hypothetical protein
MSQSSPKVAYPRGTFLGRNTITGKVDLYGSRVLGDVFVNGKKLARTNLGRRDAVARDRRWAFLAGSMVCDHFARALHAGVRLIRVPMRPILRNITSLVILFAAVACDERNPERSPLEPRASDASIKEGSGVQPTAALSFELINESPEKRRASFQETLVSAGKNCSSVREALLVDGLDGLDVWRVKCANSGPWLLTFENNNVDVEPCGSSAEC